MQPANWQEKQRSWPCASVFVAARNEAACLPACLAALARQDYPGRWEVLVGNDQSADETGKLADEFCRNNTRFSVLHLVPEPGPVQGKARVLGMLAGRASGDVFLFCDADMEMPAGWIREMVSGMEQHGVDMVNGTTVNPDRTLFESFQAIDWLLPQGTFAWLSRLGIGFTAMGNNMAISRRAYESTGGYLHLPFSLTEDFELFRHASRNGYRLIHLYHPRVLGLTHPQPGLRAWLSQHIRWMVGFMALPFTQRLLLYGQLFFYPLLVAGFFLPFPVLSRTLLLLWMAKCLYQAVLLVPVRIHLLFFLPVYELLFWPLYMACWLGYHLARDLTWKDRKWEGFRQYARNLPSRGKG